MAALSGFQLCHVNWNPNCKPLRTNLYVLWRVNTIAHLGTTEFKKINWLPVEHRVAQIKLNLVYRIANSSAPDYLQNDFNHVSQVHRYWTRHSVSSHCIPSVKTAGKTTFTYSEIKLWNELPKEIKFVTKEHKFKGAVKSYLFDKTQQSDKSDFLCFKM